MNCEQAMEWMSAKLDGELERQQDEALRAHLEACPDCRRLMEVMEGLDQKVSELREPAPEGLKRGVLYRIDQASGKVKKPLLGRWFGPGAAIGAVAAVLVLLVGLGIVPLGRKTVDSAAPISNGYSPAETQMPDTVAPAPADPGNEYSPERNEAIEQKPEAVDGKKGISYYNPATDSDPEHITESDHYYQSGGGNDGLREQPLPISDSMREACAALSRREDAMVLLYTDFTPESLFGLLEAEAPALFKLTAALEPQEAEGLIRYKTDCGTVLAIQEWLVENLPHSETMSAAAQEAETRLRIRMEELDPGSGSLYRVITWEPPDHPVKWPETWPEGWALRLRTEENWNLFFPAEDYAPSAEEPACLVFAAR